MTPIPGWVYALLGAVMIVTSQLIKRPDGSKPMMIFLWAGIVCVLIGIGKYLFKGRLKQKEDKPKPLMRKEHFQATQPVQSAQPPQTQVTHPQHPHHPRHRTHHVQHHTQHGMTHMQGQHEVHRATSQQHPPHLSIITCPACKTRHYDYANYCMKCGSKIKS
ncbi:hypothetical protein AYK26_05285 [Euryarchaeota archaeon SM23-78]|nr:MAG: hypothetical protein AYK26_05285 [Euryarchaeota archaeon SM23-78]